MSELLNTDWQTILVTAVLRLAGAALILLIGRALAGFVQRFTRGLLLRMRATPSLVKILERGAYYSALGVAVFIALVILGVPAEWLLIVVAVLFVIAAIALRESLRDLAAYVNFLVFQPFKASDQIETNGLVGTVQEILLFSTVLNMLDNRKLVLPNANIQNNTLINYSA
jgi:small conductance mechanosensitive channel